MPVLVDDVTTLKQYLRGVLADALHHAYNVDQIVLGLAGAIISRMDDDTHLEVHRDHSGGMGRALTVTIRGNRYAFSYDHDAQCISLKEGSFRGTVLHQFTNATTLAQISGIFTAL